MVIIVDVGQVFQRPFVVSFLRIPGQEGVRPTPYDLFSRSKRSRKSCHDPVLEPQVCWTQTCDRGSEGVRPSFPICSTSKFHDS